MTGKALKVSVVIRTRDKEKYFEGLLEKLALQTLVPSEILVVNNYSSEDKRCMFEDEVSECFWSFFRHRKIVLKMVALSDSEFSHAYSTNLGVHAAQNELVCIMNAHSLPISLHWLEGGVNHFRNPEVAGVSGFFLPHSEGKAFGRLDIMLYYLSQKIVLRQNWCSTINCIIRKSLWQIYPFDENLPKIIPQTKKYGLEDYDWSKEMISRGYKIIVDASFSVFHSHGKGLNEMIRNVKGYFVYRRLQQRISQFKRPRRSFSKLLA
ncbi:MAG: glycosyltransferase family 2 protein [Candidatus Bathycorpusculaceae bacterium]